MSDPSQPVPEFTDREPMPSGLLPAERLALTVARKRLDDPEYVTRSIVTVLVMTVERLLRERRQARDAIERDVRARIAASLRRAAKGRREYMAEDDGASAAIDEMNRQLLALADCHDSCAAIIEDERNILSAVPSWRWTEEELDEVRNGMRAARAERSASDGTG